MKSLGAFGLAAALLFSSCANARGEKSSPAETVVTTVNWNHFEVRSGEYNMMEASD